MRENMRKRRLWHTVTATLRNQYHTFNAILKRLVRGKTPQPSSEMQKVPELVLVLQSSEQ